MRAISRMPAMTHGTVGLQHASMTVGDADGDLMYAPGVLWTAAKHKIPPRVQRGSRFSR